MVIVNFLVSLGRTSTSTALFDDRDDPIWGEAAYHYREIDSFWC